MLHKQTRSNNYERRQFNKYNWRNSRIQHQLERYRQSHRRYVCTHMRSPPALEHKAPEEEIEDLNISHVSHQSSTGIVELENGCDYWETIFARTGKVGPHLKSILPDDEYNAFDQLLQNIHKNYSGPVYKERAEDSYNAGRHKLLPELFDQMCKKALEQNNADDLMASFTSFSEIYAQIQDELITPHTIERAILQINPDYQKPTSYPTTQVLNFAAECSRDDSYDGDKSEFRSDDEDYPSAADLFEPKTDLPISKSPIFNAPELMDHNSTDGDDSNTSSTSEFERHVKYRASYTKEMKEQLYPQPNFDSEDDSA